MIKVAFIGYRAWANQIYSNLVAFKHYEEQELGVQIYDWEFVDPKKADVILYYGWSTMIPPQRYNTKLCLILHPSPLPKYRGGSPLQHQIMIGEKESAVTICKVTDELDGGDIYFQRAFSLDGTLDEIFQRMIEIGTTGTMEVLEALANGTTKPIPQDKKKATQYSRRKPYESEMFGCISDKWTAKQAHDFIRSLNDPYPHAFIRCADGKKLYLTGSHL